MLAYVRDVVLVAVLIIGTLYLGAGFLVPLVLALLIFVLVTAISDRIAGVTLFGKRLPNWIGYILGAAPVLFGLFLIAYVLGNQATHFARALPVYEAQLDGALVRAAGLLGEDIVLFIRATFIEVDLSRIAISAFNGASFFLSTFLLICLYVAFMVSERTLFAEKLVHAASNRRLRREMRRTVDSVSIGVQRYVGVKTFLSTITALFSYAVFRYLGLEFAETWGILTFALNFIPSIGSIVAVILPALVALIQFETTGPFLTVAFGCGIVQFLIGNILDPALMGRSLNISTLMVILALTFWTAIWGIIGAFLSVPLTVCVLIVFAQIPATRPIAILMSKDGRVDGIRAPDDSARSPG